MVKDLPRAEIWGVEEEFEEEEWDNNEWEDIFNEDEIIDAHLAPLTPLGQIDISEEFWD